MARNNPISGEFYKHFKGNIYQIKCIADDSETGEKVVVYQAMYAPFKTFVRKLDMFMGETDREKYPECTQKYRFEKVTFENSDEVSGSGRYYKIEKEVSLPQADKKILDNNFSLELSDEELKKIIVDGKADSELSGKMPDKEIGQRGCMLVLDAETYHERYQIFAGLEKYLDERLLGNIAVAFDIVLGDVGLNQQYNTILENFRTWDKYEVRRLR